MADDSQFAEVRDALIALGGGYLRNPIREDRVTCSVCTTPAAGYVMCHACHAHNSAAPGRLADTVAPLTYAVAQRQSGYVMRGYKAQPPVQEHVSVVTLLIFMGIALHSRCAGTLVGAPITHWATVPSLPRKPGEHPLGTLLRSFALPWPEATLTAAERVSDARALSDQHFGVDRPLPPASSVLLIDDTWTTGGHAQSAVMALRASGASHVSVMVAARWLVPSFGDTSQFLRQRANTDYNVLLCPWTGRDCP